MNGIGTTGLIILALMALLLFGPKKLPELGAAIGKTLREFKRGTAELTQLQDHVGSAAANQQPLTRVSDQQQDH